jgi:hypothetical protein
VDNKGKVFEEENIIKMMSKDLKKPFWGHRVMLFFSKKGQKQLIYCF